MALKRNLGVRAAQWALPQSAPTPSRLTELGRVRDNPGDLRGLCFVPEGVAGPMPLVVVLHGCTQNADVYDHGSGWSMLAARCGFALLFPEQQRSNNAMLCFNWFSANDTQRGMGEAASIKSMIDTMKRDHAIDEARVFITGLSAGGAMTAVMLATYPEQFAAGAILGGLAYGCASGMAEALDCMGGRSRSDADKLSARVRRASAHSGKWPRVQVWQGDADTTVTPGNADSIVAQWAGVHGLAATPDVVDRVENHPRARWLGADGTPLVEQYTITGMAHGVPIDPRRSGGDALGSAGAHMLDVGLCSTQRIAEFFGIGAAAVVAKPSTPAKPVPLAASVIPRANRMRTAIHAAKPHASGVQAVIEKALRAAGLMR
jgi:poly(hydroxyalkanoate) depolymerase family esterase